MCRQLFGIFLFISFSGLVYSQLALSSVVSSTHAIPAYLRASKFQSSKRNWLIDADDTTATWRCGCTDTNELFFGVRSKCSANTLSRRKKDDDNTIDWPLLDVERNLLDKFINNKTEIDTQDPHTKLTGLLSNHFIEPEGGSIFIATLEQIAPSIDLLHPNITIDTDLIMPHLTKFNALHAIDNTVQDKVSSITTTPPFATESDSTDCSQTADSGDGVSISWWPIGLLFFVVGVMTTAIVSQGVRSYATWRQSRGARYVDRLQLLVRALAEKGHHDQVIQLLQKSIPQVVRYRGVAHIEVAAMRHLQARAHLSLGQWTEAQAILQLVLETYESFGEDLYLAGACEDSGIALYHIESADESVTVLRRALRIYVEDAHARSSPSVRIICSPVSKLKVGCDIENRFNQRTPCKSERADRPSLETALGELETLLSVDQGEGDQGRHKEAQRNQSDLRGVEYPLDESVARTLHRIGLALPPAQGQLLDEAIQCLQIALQIYEELCLQSDLMALEDKHANWRDAVDGLQRSVEDLLEQQKQGRVDESRFSGSPSSITTACHSTAPKTDSPQRALFKHRVL